VLHDAIVLVDLRWRAVPVLVPLGVVALLPALVIWAAATIGSLGLGHPLTLLPPPAAASSGFERLTRLLVFWAITLGGPLLAFVAGAAATVDAELRVDPAELRIRIRAPVPRGPDIGFWLWLWSALPGSCS
jgi:hypothetical protein